MFKKEILQNQKRLLELNLINRKLDINELIEVFKLNKIVAFIGPRRAGKTFLTFQLIKDLIQRGYAKIEDICYIDFSGFIEKDLSLIDIYNEYKALFPNNNPIFIFDEIQELSNFPEKLIKILNLGHKIVITGSNAHLLSKELSTILRGKVYTKEVFPLNFKEYLLFKNITNQNNSFILEKHKYKNEFLQFLKWGGFPEIVLVEDEFVKENILKTYFDIMLYKDLQDRYNIKNDFALKFFIKRVLTTFTNPININKIYNELKSQKIKISKDSLYTFYEYLINIYFISPLNNYWALVKGNKKTYLIDCAFSNLVGNENLGKRFENLVYLELLRKYNEIYFLGSSYEIDFFIPKEKAYIQVVYDLNFENIDRETKYLSKQQGKKFLIYFEKENKLSLPKDIDYIDFYMFLE